MNPYPFPFLNSMNNWNNMHHMNTQFHSHYSNHKWNPSQPPMQNFNSWNPWTQPPTNRILGLLGGGTPIQETSFPIANLLNNFLTKNTLNHTSSTSSCSYKSRIILHLIFLYDRSCLLNLTPTQTIK